jgi:hypothetical protein
MISHYHAWGLLDGFKHAYLSNRKTISYVAGKQNYAAPNLRRLPAADFTAKAPLKSSW